MNEHRQPKGVPTGGQFAATSHSECAVKLNGPGLDVDNDAANHFADQVESIQAAGLQGTLASDGEKLTYTTADGDCSFDIEQAEFSSAPEVLGYWVISNEEHTNTDDPGYGTRYEILDGADIGERLEEAVWDSRCMDNFTLSHGGMDYEFREFNVTRSPVDEAVSDARFTHLETDEELEVYFNHDTGNITVYSDDEVVHGTKANKLLKPLVTATELDMPHGSATDQMKWHLERSFRTTAAHAASPEWTHKYRVAGLG